MEFYIHSIRQAPACPTSVIRAVHEPAGGLTIAIHAVERAIGERDVPFVACPGVWRPPIAGAPPGAGGRQHFPLHTAGGDVSGMPTRRMHVSVARRPEY